MRKANGVLSVILGLIVIVIGLSCSKQTTQPPETAKRPVVDEYYGIKVTDNYRWLEDGEDPEVQVWIDKQNEYTHNYLDKIHDREAISRRLTALYEGESPKYYSMQYEGGLLFALKSAPTLEQPQLVTLTSAYDTTTQQIVLDVNTVDTTGATSIDFYTPSLDGKLVAVSLSEGGSELGSVHVYNVATGEELPDIIPNVNGPTAGGSVAWNKSGNGFYYTRYPAEGERPEEDLLFYQQVYYHKLGTDPGDDSYVIGKEFPKIAEIELTTSYDGNYILATVANGDGGEYAHYLLGPNGKWTQITQFSDLIPTIVFAPDDQLYLLSHKDASNGKILSLSPKNPDLKRAKLVIPEGEGPIEEFLPTDTRLYVIMLLGGPSRVIMYDRSGKLVNEVPMQPVSTAKSAFRLQGDTIMVDITSYVQPPAWYRYEPTMPASERTMLYMTSPADFSHISVLREFATSKDGTRVPMTIIHKEGINLNGKNPTILYGYGGYGISMRPSFDATRIMWLNSGGVYVVGNIRGGGEFGEAWHLAGNLTNKQNVFDDFVACAQYLINENYTNPDKLAIKGGSNGGLLMGAALTQHPELFRAVVSTAGMYDMLRTEIEPNGVFNITEFGTVKDSAQFAALYAYSPYHHVVDSTAYPAVLMLAGVNDGRVDPYQSRKMTAALQAATISGLPILLRTSAGTGHGYGTSRSAEIAEDTDIWTFLFHELNVNYTPE